MKVDAERRYLHRVVQNLVGNAVRYCDNKVRITGGIHNDGMALSVSKTTDRVFLSKTASVYLKPLPV